MTRPPHDISASVKQRLLNLARAQGEDFNTLLVRYAIERFLYRLSKSSLSDQMVLKGAMLFVVWRPTPHRPTRDLDLLGFGDPSPESVAERIKDILATTFEDDGLHFDSESIEAGPIREDQTYGGVRVTFRAMLGKARIDLQVDVGFGDAVVGPNVTASYPSLLGFPAAVIRVYSREAVIAEKLHAMVELGSVNSRMKDFYDILILSREFDFDDRGLVETIAATFQRRGRPLPVSIADVLTPDFAADKQTQWSAFLKRLRLKDAPPEFAKVVESLIRFLAKPVEWSTKPSASPLRWPPGGPWR